jgi:hypothetical protein
LIATRVPARACARALRVLDELELAELDRSGAVAGCRLLGAERTELDRSPTYAACLARLREAERRLMPAAARAA